MKGKISIITLLVADMKKSISFYRDGHCFRIISLTSQGEFNRLRA